MENEKGFSGVFSRDNLKKKINKFESGIVNLDSVTGPGTHWVCYYNDPTKEYTEYFDSFGLPPPEEVKKYLKTSGKNYVIYNSSQLQKNNSVLCGYYCMKYIVDRNKNMSQYDVLYSFTNTPSDFNEKLALGGDILGRDITGGDIVSWLQDKINPPEMHLITPTFKKYNFCGPFTKLEQRLKRGDIGINRVDEACKRHDIAYSKTKDTSQRNISDGILLKE